MRSCGVPERGISDCEVTCTIVSVLVSVPRLIDASDRPLPGEVLVFVGRLLTLDRTEAQQLARHLGAEVCEVVTDAVTVCVSAAEGGGRRKRVDQINLASPDRVLTEDRFCELAGVPSPSALRAQYYSRRGLRDRYRHLRADHLEYLQKDGGSCSRSRLRKRLGTARRRFPGRPS